MSLRLEFLRNTLSFDGVNDYVEVANSASLNPTSSITLCYWLYLLGNTGTYQSFVRKNLQYIFGWIDLNYTRFSCVFYTTSWNFFDFSKTPSQLQGAWHFYATTWPAPEDGKVRNYLDGALDTSYTFTGPINTTTNPLLLGRAPQGYYGWGIMHDVRIYNRVLSEWEIRTLYYGGDIRDGLVLYLPMDEGSGSTVYDKSGNNNNGTIYGATWTQSWRDVTARVASLRRRVTAKQLETLECEVIYHG